MLSLVTAVIVVAANVVVVIVLMAGAVAGIVVAVVAVVAPKHGVKQHIKTATKLQSKRRGTDLRQRVSGRRCKLAAMKVLGAT